MIKYKTESRLMDIIINGLSFFTQAIFASISPHISDGTEIIMKNIDNRMKEFENRIIRKMYSFLILGFGAIFLIISLFFFLIESLGLSNSLVFFSIGITVFLIGIYVKLSEFDKK
ncbi:MAG: hypothetical protein WC867_04265 [Candidatus Pacearchaeota archaeon]|jgi:VIT1/CCC1 family predicted Fe2+/Mn2+ transporter